jgi:apolipoprotein N-acyltransferase
MAERAAARLTPWTSQALAALLGAAESLAFAPASLWPLGILSLAGLWWLWQDAPPRRAAALGFSFGLGLYLSGTYWLYTSIHVFGQAPLILALLLMAGLVAIMSGYIALTGWLLAWLQTAGPVYSLAVLPAGWVVLEWFRGWFLSGFPWLALGYSEIDTPLAGFAPLFGVYGVSFAGAVTAGALAGAVAWRRREQLLALMLVLAIWLGGALLRGHAWTQAHGSPLSVSIVQGAIPQDLKWQEDNRAHTLEIYRSLTEQAWGSRLIVWPEAALPALYHELLPFIRGIAAEAHEHQADLLLGLVRYDFDTQEFRNGLLAIGDGQESWYYKRRLVPFGEFFPVPAIVRSWMRLKNLAYVDLTSGTDTQPPLAAAGQRWAATICYEDAYGVEQLDALRDATLLVNVSNDAWFGDSTAPHQHLEITRMRALEAGRDMVRATNNGISALIRANGRLAARSRQFVPEVLRGEVQPYRGLTPYARLRNWPVLVLAVLCLGAGAWRARRAARRPLRESPVNPRPDAPLSL